jgi:glycine/D-amino acid oxidase-like deaminating enzyme
VGLRPATPDELPIIGRSTVLPNVIYAAGHYRNGVLLSGLTAQLVAGLMLDESDDPLLEHTRPDRFGAV